MELKRFIPNSLYGRFLLIIAVPILIVQIVSIYVFFYTHIDNISKHMARGVVEEMKFIQETIDDQKSQKFLQNFSKRINLAFEIKNKSQAHSTQSIINNNYQYIKPIIDPYNQFKMELERYGLEPTHIGEDPADSKQIIVEIPHNNQTILFKISTKRLTSSSGYVFTLWMALTAIITLSISIIFLKNQVRSIKNLSEAAEKLGRGIDSPNLKAYGSKEVRLLAISFKKMQERLMRQMSQRTDMLSGVSHDLRTPLTRMKLQLELMPKSEETTDLKNDIADMEKLVEEYLNFAKNDDKEKSSQIEIKKFIKEQIITYYAKMGKEINCHLNVTNKLKLSLKKLSLKRALINLIDNAFNHADSVELIVSESNSNLMIIIDDNGPGIAKEEREKVIRPFYRIDNSRNLDKKSNSSGSGLGLAIATDAITSQGGHIRLSESHLGGLRVTIFLPK
ncbi:MAG: ATP-binding protein [Rickettsiales bacterium]|nr:ATP-binding protein [Rickettsiales bacterium]